MEIDVGQLIAGKYELVRLIGKGAMGEVWLASHNSLGGEFAIKLVKPSDNHDDANAAARFQLEAQISAKLSRRTRHIISVSDHGEENGLAYLVMELLEGESLEARITRSGRLSLAETAAIVMQIARALEQAHAEGIFHRDLKPANLFLTRDEEGRLLVKVLDFGIARSNKPFRTRSPVMTGKDMVLGTPSYMSPEQARGLDSLDHRCDVWALAVVAYESLTGDIPWEGETLEDIFLSICTHRVRPILGLRPDLPPAIAQVFERSFAEKLDARFGSALELSDALELLVDPGAVEAAAGPRVVPASARRMQSDHDLPSAMVAVGSPAERAPTTRRWSGWLIAAIAAIVTLGVVLLGLRSFTGRRGAVPAAPPSNPVAAVPSAMIAPPVEPAAPTALPAPVVTAKPPPPASPAKASHRVAQPVAVAPVVTQAPPPVAPPPPPPPAAPLRSAPPAPPPGPPDKSGVF
ncbi:MAG TPA: serine/threonine-protein kinase [Labilithrix sp.]|nr:serine/threonine-protein kinase [Labilithrix sp.]